MATLAIFPRYRFFTAVGLPLAGGKLYTYQAGTTTPLATYTDSGAGTPNANPIILDANGECPVPWISGSLYKFVLKDSADVTQWTQDNISDVATITSDALRTDLANTSDVAKGDALIGFKSTSAGGVARTVHAKLAEHLSLDDFGAVGDGTTNDATAIQAAIDAMAALGGGDLYCSPGKTYRSNSTIIVKDYVRLHLNGATIKSYLSGTNDYGMRLMNKSMVCDGVVQTVSSGTPSASAPYHSAITIGPAYGDGGTAASPSAHNTVAGWVVRNVKAVTDKAGGVAIQMIGGVNHGVIEGVEVPDSAVIAGGIHLDWGSVGGISSSDVPGTRTLFDDGTAYTSHPHNISIRNIKIGNLSRAKAAGGTYGVRISGCHHIEVNGVEVAGSTYAGVFHHAGDLGYEFAPAADKNLACRGITIKNVNILAANDGWGCFVDANADNVEAAVSGSGYVNLIPYILETNLLIENVRTKGNAGASAVPGFRAQKIKGLRVLNCEATAHEWGFLFEVACEKVIVEGGRFYTNRKDGLYCGHATNPQDCAAIGVWAYGNGTDGGYGVASGIFAASCKRFRVENCVLGATSEATQDYGIRLDASTVYATVKNNYVTAVQAGGVGYVLATSTDYGAVWEFSGNDADASVTTFLGGVNIVPFQRNRTAAGGIQMVARALRASLTASITPTAGAWIVGDVIFYLDPTLSDYVGTTCTVAGSPGTWKRFGATTA